MPTISRFYGIVIQIYWRDHPPPHFHAVYQDDFGVFAIADCSLIAGNIAPQQRKRVRQWWELHSDDIAFAWQQARQNEEPNRIEPLR